MSVFYVYILEATSKKGKKSYYTGYTNNLLRRWREHRNGKGSKYCRSKNLELKYFETFTDRRAAMKREFEIKQFSRKEKINLIKNSVD